jgi:hypothetical protein
MKHLTVARAEFARLTRAGENTATEEAVFEADHGSGRRALSLGRRAWRLAPSVRGADALGWALTRSGRPAAGLRFAKRALRLGAREPLWLFHAGIAADGAGEDALGRRLLHRALSVPGFSPLHAQEARRALRG